MFEVKVVPVEPCDPACRKRKIKPILFNTDMVKAILDGRKTQTRRVVKGIEGLNVYRAEPAEDAYETLHQWDFLHGFSENGAFYDMFETVNAPCAVGDILWVRETWCKGRVEYGEEPDGRNVPYIGQCTGDDNFIPKEWALRHDVGIEDVVWRPSIHMPRSAARIFLRVKNVRVERLQDISVLDAINEGCCGTICDHANANPALGCTDCHNTGWLERPETEFALLWDTTVKKDDLPVYGWEANPWVWVIEFERCEKPEGWCVTD